MHFAPSRATASRQTPHARSRTRLARLHGMPKIDGRSALIAGLFGAAVFVTLELWLATIRGEGTWLPMRMVAAIVLGPSVLPPPGGYDPSLAAVAAIIVVPVALFHALVLGAFVRRMSASTALIVGALYGIAIYAIDFYSFVPFFPWLAWYRGPQHILAHVGYGMVTAAAYEGLHALRVRRHRFG